MQLPYRVAAPPEPDEPETEEPYARLLRMQQRRARVAASVAAGVLGALVVAAMARPAPAKVLASDAATREEARRTRAREAIASAHRHAAEAQERFAAELRTAVTSEVAPREDLGACPITLTAPGGIARGHAFPLVVVDRSEVEAGAVPSQAVAEVLGDVRRAEAHLAAGRYEEASLYAQALQHPGRLVLDVVLVATESKRPAATSDSAFVPGEIGGRAYLYDFASQRVVCAADVRARSSPSIGYAYAIGIDAPVASGRAASLRDAVELDMRAQLERAVASAMRYRAAPR